MGPRESALWNPFANVAPLAGNAVTIVRGGRAGLISPSLIEGTGLP